LAANDPPASADHLDDDEWHAAQDKWLVKWSGSVLFDEPQAELGSSPFSIHMLLTQLSSSGRICFTVS
jgi:hypothetical protein